MLLYFFCLHFLSAQGGYSYLYPYKTHMELTISLTSKIFKKWYSSRLFCCLCSLCYLMYDSKAKTTVMEKRLHVRHHIRLWMAKEKSNITVPTLNYTGDKCVTSLQNLCFNWDVEKYVIFKVIWCLSKALIWSVKIIMITFIPIKLKLSEPVLQIDFIFK